MQRTLQVIILLIGFTSFSWMIRHNDEEPVPIPPSVQRNGDPMEGYKYLVTGDYVKGGIPYEFYTLGFGKPKHNYLRREGLNGNVSHEYTVVKASNGENVVAPNCMLCHAQVFDSTLYIGLGNTFIDFTNSQRLDPQYLTMIENMLKKASLQKYEASKAFLQVSKTVGPFLNTEVRGVNAADRLTALLMAHRDPDTFKWSEKATLEIPKEVIPSDVPAWWLLKKKNAMFYNGLGRGDFGRFLMVSNLLTVSDTSESSEVDTHFNDVLAYIRSLDAPKYPFKVNEMMAKSGEAIFIKNCSKCHGKYGDQEEYPNLLIPASVIKTDSLLFMNYYENPQSVNWFNKSWFAKGDHPARMEPFKGYIAPPLDGVWITSPYLHNGSVPTIEAVLNSKIRPKYWSRNFDDPKYNYESVGWQYKAEDKPGGTTIYNTELPGYGNKGHYFGDKLSDNERKAVIEYLKTL